MARVLSETISTASNSSPSPDCASLRSWSSRSPLVMSTSRVAGRQRPDRLGGAVDQIDRMGQHLLPGLDDLPDHPRRHPFAGDLDRGLDHRQDEALDAEPVVPEIAPLGRFEPLGQMIRARRSRRAGRRNAPGSSGRTVSFCQSVSSASKPIVVILPSMYTPRFGFLFAQLQLGLFHAPLWRYIVRSEYV